MKDKIVFLYICLCFFFTFNVSEIDSSAASLKAHGIIEKKNHTIATTTHLKYENILLKTNRTDKTNSYINETSDRHNEKHLDKHFLNSHRIKNKTNHNGTESQHLTPSIKDSKPRHKPMNHQSPFVTVNPNTTNPINTGAVIDVPMTPCPNGSRRDRRGRCRQIFDGNSD